MKLLIIGSGGREHALAWKLAQDMRVEHIYCAPGNGGTADEYKVSNVDIGLTNTFALRQFAEREQIDLTIVGPEVALSAGIVDCFQTYGLRVFGPTRAAAQLETSKIYAKNLMKRLGIPTAKYVTFSNDQDALNFLDFVKYPRHGLVIKADGLASGKGVFMCPDKASAESVITDLMLKRTLGDAGDSIVIEERLQGQERSFFVLTDGVNMSSLGYAKDYKRLLVGNKGPNTGGMGAFSGPCVDLPPKVHNYIIRTIVQPLLHNSPYEYRGLLYVGLMLVPNKKPHVLEFNARFGDPETQALLRRVDGDLLTAMMQVSDMSGHHLQKMCYTSSATALCVTLASEGYPTMPTREQHPITGIPQAEDTPRIKVFHAGTVRDVQNVPWTNGGRVLNVTNVYHNFGEGRQCLYDAVEQIHFEGKQYRKDIGS